MARLSLFMMDGLSVLALFLLICRFGGAQADIMPPSKAPPTQKDPFKIETHSLATPYLDRDTSSKWWDLGGDYVVDVNSEIRLTPDLPSKTGYIFSKAPLPTSAFDLILHYKIHGKPSKLFGDGMALWFTADRYQPGEAFGHSTRFKGLGVFIDTYPNKQHAHAFPHISMMYNDGTKEFDHQGDNLATQLAPGCEAAVRNANYDTKLKVSYVPNKYIKVFINSAAQPDDWQLCTEATGITLSPPLYVGVTAATGQIHGIHDVISLEMRRIPMQEQGTSPPVKETHAPPIAAPWQFKWRLFQFGVVVLIVGVALYAYRAYKHSREAKYF